MAPTRKSRSVNKRYSYINEVSRSRDGDNANKKTNRKKKLSDMLGTEWSKEELERFYAAYRKHGKDWKKVAAVVRNRSSEMAEALYTMNRAYLSLPEGTASVAGLIAMMTDYYSNLARTDSEQESNDGAGTSRKPQKRAPVKVQPSACKGSEGLSLFHTQAVGSNYGGLTLLKKKRSGGTRPRAVGKRTPRFPVSYSYENVNGEKYCSPSRLGLKPKMDANDDEVAHEIALALAEASQRVGSPQVSQTPNRRTMCDTLSPVTNAKRMHAGLEMLIGSDMDEDGLEGSMEADNGDSSRDKGYLMETRGVGPSVQKGRKHYGKKVEVDDSGSNHLDDIREACSGTEEGQNLGAGRGKFDIEVSDAKISRSSSGGPRKRSKKALFRRDEVSAFDALQTLANLSLMMPDTTNENEQSVQVKEENDDHVGESGLLEAMPANRQKEKRKTSGVKVKGTQSISKFEVSTVKASKPGKLPVLDGSAIAEGKQDFHQSITKLSRKKHKTLASKIPKVEAHGDTHLSEYQEAEAPGKESGGKGRRSSQSASPKLFKYPERSSSSTDPRREGSETALSSIQVPVKNQVNLATKVRNKRKIDLEKPQIIKDLKFSDETVRNHASAPFPSLHDRALDLKGKLSNCLLNRRLRRRCTFEWFYSAIDYPWFAKREFVEYLYHVGLGHVPRLTRVEWGVIRSSLGKPRRFSEQFLKEEKEKLNQYRNSVRTHYTELRSGTREGLPTDLARPLSVGQRVIAIHPITREIHDGSVLTVDHDRCRVQFDRPELGVEFVMDIDCMPLNPLENMPTSLARPTFAVDKFFENFNELKINGQAKDQRLDGYMKLLPGENLEKIDSPSHASPSAYIMCNLLKQAKFQGQVAPTIADSQTKMGTKETAANLQTAYSMPCTLAQLQANEADVQAIAELTRALDKKEAVVSELRRMNDDVSENKKDGTCALKDSEPFKKQYAAVLIQLNEANEQLSSALYCLRQRNTYQGNFSHTWPRPMANLVDSGGGLLTSSDRSANHVETSAHANEIVESSRTKARTMVDAAMQAMKSLKGGGNSFEKIEEAIDYVNDRLPLDDACTAPMRPSTNPDPDHGSLTSRTLVSMQAPELKNASDRNEVPIPSELISHCVATLLMIQKCTERQFPPADVAQILDSAVTSLKPCCSQNLPVYDEIQKCMGIIRNQIMALVPT
ncbi:hypothetical protein LguiB_025674 [Lonicera macranthoides]